MQHTALKGSVLMFSTTFKLLFHSLRDDWVLVGLCYPSDTTFQIMSDTYDRQSNTFDDITDYGTVLSFPELQKKTMERKYYFDQTAGWDERLFFPFPCLNSQLEILQCDDCRRFGFLIKNEINFISIVFLFFLIPLWLYWVSKSLLFLIIPSLLWLYLRARHGRDGHSYCSVKGCERVKITATTSSKETCNCTAKAYPKYAKAPSVVVPMPALNTQPCRDCGAKQVC